MARPGPNNVSPCQQPGEESFADLLRHGEAIPTGLQIEQLTVYRDLLFETNKSTNLTAIRDLPGIERRLILESLRLVKPLLRVIGRDASRRIKILDIGTGGGLPGLVLAIALPGLAFTLLDATGKKVAFVQEVITRIGLANAVALHGRAEDIGRDSGFRGQFDVAVARAVTSLPALIELGLPLIRRGGHLLLPKGEHLDDELEAGQYAASVLGGEIVEASLLPNAGSGIATRLVIVEKTAPTPGAYPRRAGIPSRNPLNASSCSSRSGTSRRGGNRPER